MIINMLFICFTAWLYFYNRLYSTRRLIGSRLIESDAYCNQILLAQLYINSAQNTSVNWIIRLLLSLLCRSKVILLSGGHCIFNNNESVAHFKYAIIPKSWHFIWEQTCLTCLIWKKLPWTVHHAQGSKVSSR